MSRDRPTHRRATFITIAGVALALSASPSAAEWKTLTTADGILGNFVYGIAKDRAGDLWVGFGSGVGRYDGERWTNFPTQRGYSIVVGPSGRVWAAGGEHGGLGYYDGTVWRNVPPPYDDNVYILMEDHAGRVWIGGLFGVNRSDSTLTSWERVGGSFALCFMEDHTGAVWCGTSQGLLRSDGSGPFTPVPELSGIGVNSILEDQSGTLWFATIGRGVSRYDGSGWSYFTRASTGDILKDDNINSVFEDRTGSLWFGTGPGVVARYDGHAWASYSTADGLPNNIVHSMAQDSPGTIWFGTEGGGLSRYDVSSWKSFTNRDGLGSLYVLSLLADESGNAWVATYDWSGYGHGVGRYNGEGWRQFQFPYLDHDEVQSIVPDVSGNVWIATWDYDVDHFDGSNWIRYPSAALQEYSYARPPTHDARQSSITTPLLFVERSGAIWTSACYWDAYGRRYRCGSLNHLVDGSWINFTTANTNGGLGSVAIQSAIEDRSGNLWFGYGGGVSRYNSSGWTKFAYPDVPLGEVNCMLEDHSGRIWFGSSYGVVSFDGSTWTEYPGSPSGSQSILEDLSGHLWFLGAPAGYTGSLVRYDGSSWETFDTSNGLPTNYVSCMHVDRFGNLWAGTPGYGVARYDGSAWRTFTTGDGLASNNVYFMTEDRSGNMWFAFGYYGVGVSRYEPDRVAPNTVFVSAPARLTPARDQVATFTAAFGEDRIEFSYRLDGGSWSGWSPVSTWFGRDLTDGTHVLEARSRDYLDNTDLTPTTITFEVDATPPAAAIASPQFGQALHGVAEIRGTATDPRFRTYWIEARASGTSSPWDTLKQASTPATDQVLTTWDTTHLPDGSYDLRLSVRDTLDLIGTTLITVLVDNEPPLVDVTTPARVSASTGGDVFTTNREAHLYFPPHAFRDDAVVTVTALADASVPDTLPAGALEVQSGYSVSWSGSELTKPARLEFRYTAFSQSNSTLAFYHSSDGATWKRVGGTTEKEAGRVSLAITNPGRYALFAESAVVVGEGLLSSISFTPRVFSPTGSFADREVGIGFQLGRPSPVTVRVYSRSGRLVREVVSGAVMNAGGNLVRWNGRDRNGGFVSDGLYLVTIQALGRTESRTLAVVK